MPLIFLRAHEFWRHFERLGLWRGSGSRLLPGRLSDEGKSWPFSPSKRARHWL
ncbi:hypothetical protein LINPERHAP1_LOCUS31080 [Linum perenne]